MGRKVGSMYGDGSMWLQKEGLAPGSRYHLAVPGPNAWTMVAACSPMYRRHTSIPLDSNRVFNKYNPSHDQCRACITAIYKEADEEMDQQDGTNYGYDDTALYGARPAPVVNKRVSLEARIARHEAEAEYNRQKLARLEALPEEPVVDDGEPNMIWFTKVWKNGTNKYTYGAIRTEDGLWWTTGAKNPKARPWQELVEWIADGDEYEIWQATQYQGLG